MSDGLFLSQILLNENMKRVIVGEAYECASASQFHGAVYCSFLDTLVQSLCNLTSDITEYLRLGRALWPRYVSPVNPANIDKTLATLRKANVSKGNKQTTDDTATIQREILSLLDQRIFPQIRYTIEHGVGALAFDSPAVVVAKSSNASTVNTSSHEVPFLVKYLLLAAYVCQVNRPDKDKQLFSIQKNGKKRRNANDEAGEGEAFGTGSQDRLKTLRPRAFPMERLYSLYVSMVSLNPSNELSQDNYDAAMHQDEMLRSLGNISFHETVAYLRDIGILHDHPKRSASENIRLSQRNFWSSITRDEAQAVAKSVKFPLDRYIL
jgi:Origin recognition complex (ORC) subunit 5 C-terminus